MAPYPRRGRHGEVVHELGLRIVRGDYAPGQIIDIDALEQDLGVSRIVIREALRVLSAKGLLDSRQRLGTFARERTSWNLLDSDVMMWRREAQRDDDTLLADLGELRDVFEPAAARLAAVRRTDADVAALEDAVRRLGEAGRDVSAIAAADIDFHVGLLAATHNELFTRLDVLVVHAVGARDRILHMPGGPAWRDPVPDHLGVLDAVRRGDAPGAFEAMTFLTRESDRDLRSGEPAFTAVR
ncbi:FadR/GntR family transcriptional regulator [Microlunatus flavus]|uniref:DNA-binding transcriptional regulator, FadR family n=1 Tax=Microlunatus flavus TaxID=1036181 RepID=A0A1H9KE53_9ACTN|nr:FCD domain-containing protein [Microlunatus flavus]SEQ97143.1 DNA-binding transcriptional regulator, FadR family [Microlunatus flavus]